MTKHARKASAWTTREIEQDAGAYLEAQEAEREDLANSSFWGCARPSPLATPRTKPGRRNTLRRSWKLGFPARGLRGLLGNSLFPAISYTGSCDLLPPLTDAESAGFAIRRSPRNDLTLNKNTSRRITPRSAIICRHSQMTAFHARWTTCDIAGTT
jgi:hypothetical protein